MTLEVLERRVSESVGAAPEHATKCQEMVGTDGLATALEYCAKLGIEPPQCSLTAQSPNAEKLRRAAQQKLSDSKWWKKVLEAKALRDYESEQIAQGNVRNFVSDGLFQYTQKKKGRST